MKRGVGVPSLQDSLFFPTPTQGCRPGGAMAGASSHAFGRVGAIMMATVSAANQAFWPLRKAPWAVGPGNPLPDTRKSLNPLTLPSRSRCSATAQTPKSAVRYKGVREPGPAPQNGLQLNAAPVSTRASVCKPMAVSALQPVKVRI